MNSLLKITLVTLVLGISLFTFNNLYNSNNTVSTEENPELTMHPAWASEWKMFKDEGAESPENILGYYRKNLYGSNVNLRSEDNLSNVQELGPDNIGGRTRAFLIDAANHDHFFAGGISGGLWESFDQGESWTPKSDKDENLSVTFIAQNPFNSDILYYSTGEVTGNSTGVNGVGLFKSVDGGKTFELLPASEQNGFFSTWRVVCSKTDSATLFVSGSKGLYVSRDHGDTFEQVLSSDCTDIELLPDSTILIGVNRGGVFKATEKEPSLTTKLNIPFRPNTNFRRVEMAYSASDINVMYAAFEDASTRQLLDIFKSVDGGLTWQITNPTNITTNFTWYCHALEVHPEKPDLVMYGSVGAGFSQNGGSTWTKMTGSHADKHLFYFHPDDPDIVYVCSDGGIDEFVFENNKFVQSFSLNNGYNITQFYTGAYYPDQDRVLGGTQDNGTLRARTQGLAYNRVYGGDGSFCAIDQTNSDRAIVSYQNAKIFRTSNFNGTRINWEYIMKEFENSSGSISNAYFINPVYLNPHDQDQIVMIKRNGVWLSPDFGDTWNKISRNLNNPYCQAIAKTDTGYVMYVGGQSGLLYRLDDMENGDNTSGARINKTMPGNIAGGFIRGMVLDPFDDNVLYVSLSTVSEQPRVWKISDINTSEPVWESISGDLPQYLPANDIAISSIDANYIAIATDYGLYTTVNGGETWERDETIPNVSVHQVKIRKDSKLYAYTHGRGIWSADFESDIVSDQSIVDNSEVKLFPNPAKDILNISSILPWEIKKYEIYTSDGKLLKLIGDNDIQNNKSIINVSDLASGTYILNINGSGNQIISKKFNKL